MCHIPSPTLCRIILSSPNHLEAIDDLSLWKKRIAVTNMSPTKPILILFLVYCLHQVQSSPTGPQQVTAPLDPTSTLALVVTRTTSSIGGSGAVSCATGGGGWYIDPLIAQKLGSSFCSSLSQEQVMPKEGETRTVDIARYPSDLGPVSAFEDRCNMSSGARMLQRARSNADVGLDKFYPYLNTSGQMINTTLIEIDGAIVEFIFARRPSVVASDSLFVHGTDEQCAMDNCTEFLHKSIDTCKQDRHSIAGGTLILSECGLYMSFVQNCSGNYVDPDCDEWHKRWPDAGPRENETLYWNITHNVTSHVKMQVKGFNDAGEEASESQEEEDTGLAVDIKGMIEAGLFQVVDWV